MKLKFVTALCIGALLFCACSYRLVREGSAELPGGVKRVSVPLADNRTIEAGLSDIFTRELIKRLLEDGRVEVAPAGEAQAKLACELSSLVTRPVSYSEQGRIAAREAQLSASCRLVTEGSESPLWETGEIKAGEQYPISNDYLLNEKAKETAIVQACKDLSESVRSLLLDSF